MLGEGSPISTRDLFGSSIATFVTANYHLVVRVLPLQNFGSCDYLGLNLLILVIFLSLHLPRCLRVQRGDG